MATEWYYATNGEQLGPVPTSQLKQLVANGTVGPDNLLWEMGMPSWVPARNVKGLFPTLLPVDPSMPPPVPLSVVEQSQPQIVAGQKSETAVQILDSLAFLTDTRYCIDRGRLNEQQTLLRDGVADQRVSRPCGIPRKGAP
jgi:hypothetical protein